MNAQQRGILSAYKHTTEQYQKKENNIKCSIKHNKAGFCVKCEKYFLKWICYDENDNIIDEVYISRDK
tara:strand:- start:5768 stop:5971 length:204 start_codon:yes stop_codon:yes gene_type:complete